MDAGQGRQGLEWEMPQAPANGLLVGLAAWCIAVGAGVCAINAWT